MAEMQRETATRDYEKVNTALKLRIWRTIGRSGFLLYTGAAEAAGAAAGEELL